jgi:hypothetical protein
MIQAVYMVKKITAPKYDNLSAKEIEEILSDGRAQSPWSEALMRSNFTNLHKSKDEHFDIEDDLGNKYESRVMAKSDKVSLIPSGQLGKGRVYDQNAYLNKCNNMTGFIITVHPTTRHLVVCSLPSSMILNSSPILKTISKKFLEKELSISFDEIVRHLDENPNKILKI